LLTKKPSTRSSPTSAPFWKNSFRITLITAVLLFAAGCSRLPFSGMPQKTGTASWYGREFHGRNTASGIRYNMYGLTAAHKTLPLGTKVLVTNLENGKQVVVIITDRGPAGGDRIIDLSYGAARQLGMAKEGLAKVRIEVIQNSRRT
jgi:rare lipoprotein A (peptidoglycan hydrolase)